MKLVLALLLVILTLSPVSAKLPDGYTCQTIRAGVAKYKNYPKWMIRAYLASWKAHEIRSARRCLPRSKKV